MDGDLGRYQELVDGARGVLEADDAKTDAADPEGETDEADAADG